MIRKFFLTILVGTFLISCRSSKVTTLVQSTKSINSDELKSFMDAESIRLSGDSKKALKQYQEFVTKYPNNAAALFNLAKISFQRKDIDNAEKNLALATKLEPKNIYFLEYYTQILVYQDKIKLAENNYNKLIELQPDNIDYYFKKAMLYTKSKNYDKAIETLNFIENKTGFNEDIIEQKKTTYLRQGKTELAIKELQKLKNAYPQSVQYAIALAEIYQNNNQLEKYHQIYNELENAYPDEPMAQVALAQHYLENHDKAQYNKFMQKIMSNKNLDVDTKIGLIIPSLKDLDNDSSNNREEVISMSKAIAEQAPDNKEALSLYADVLYYAKDYELALIQYKKLLKIDKSKFNTWSQISTIYFEQNKLDSVINYSNESLTYFPNKALPYFFIGTSYVMKKESKEAIEKLNKALELEYENQQLRSQIYSTLGDAYNSEKLYLKSDSCFEYALKIQPNDATSLNNYAYYLSLRKEKLDIAESMSKKSLFLDPNSKSFLDTYGWILFQQGKYTEAKEYIEKAISASSEEDGTLYEHLGDILFKMNQKDRAIENWNKAKRLGDSNPILLKKIKDEKLYE